ncbi:transcription factor NAI1 [Eucalyptus grandis]|uniref:transcription factor NAI1 n=1 Tax=Eucalyptus grandis TaxID=71139 RepID=UPI00192E8BEA|nr:transcription factor NAI1 [Eucalyptus grandis]
MVNNSRFLGTPESASMEILSSQLFPEIVTEETLHHMYQHHQMNAFDFPLEDFDSKLFSSETYSPSETTRGLMDLPVEVAPTIMERPMKMPKTERWSNSCSPGTYKAPTMVMSSPSSSSQLISFGSLDSFPTESQQIYGAYKIQDCQTETDRTGPMSRPPMHTRKHLIAERMRREKLSQSFIALSAIIPGLKKMDKASILSHAINYMKQLQERVKKLEEEVAIRTVESVVIGKKSQVSAYDDMFSLDENSNHFEQQLPEIEARVLDKHVLLRIHHEKRKGRTTEILREIEKLNLSILNSSVLSFGSSILEMTIVAQMDVDFCMNIEDLVKNLRSSILRYMVHRLPNPQYHKGLDSLKNT